MAELFCVLMLVFGAQSASAQELPEPPSVQLAPPEALRRGQPAPRDGLFVEPATYFGLVRQIEGLEFRLGHLVRTERDICARRVEIETLRTGAERDRLTLRDGLWQQRQTELLARITEAQAAAQRQWYEQPVLWLVLGGALVGIIVGIVAAAVSG